MNWKERTYCGDVSRRHIGSDVILMGWVDAIRDHGHILFIHLRDVQGIVQAIFDPNISADTYQPALELRQEDVIEITGTVAQRAEGTENPNLATGDLEVFVREINILSKANPLPFQISEKAMVFGEEIRTSPESLDEELRLRYRYLDMRRPSIQRLFRKRHEVVQCIREILEERRFIEVETPFLTKSTPEGARDYLVPSRVHQGRFYALPQSPQLFKQMLMMGGMDRYFQIARCFRDEDLRPNRQPEFTQLDLEASFIDEEFVYELIEELTCRMFRVGDIQLPRPFPRMTYQEAVSRYGTDRPDTRFGMTFEDVTPILQDTNYSIFRDIIQKGGLVKGFCVKAQAHVLSKNVLQNEYAQQIVPSFGGSGMTWMKVANGTLESNIVQFFSRSERDRIMSCFDAEEGDVLLMIADTSHKLVHSVLCDLRLHVAKRIGLIGEDAYSPLWITDFPLFELKEDGIQSLHHPFTMPDRTDFDPKNETELLTLRSRAYDLVVNGEELGGGSIRIHTMDVQRKVFDALGLSSEEIESKFGFFLKAFEYGTPPHGGLALGLDRMIAMILKTPSIREVIAFPKNRSALCPLTRAPSPASPHQLEELGLLKGSGRDAKKTVKEHVTADHRPSKKKTTITREEVQHVARLARLKISESEAERLQKDLSAVLNHFDTLQELDTRDVAPMSHVLELKNVWREDQAHPADMTEALLRNAPDREETYFKVPRILEG